VSKKAKKSSVEKVKINTLWLIEARRRREEVLCGKVQAISGEEALERVRKTVDN